MSSPRRKLDQYFTPASATVELLKHIHLTGNVLECCNGDGGISNELLGGAWTVWTNDIDTSLQADFHLDASDRSNWAFMNAGGVNYYDWVVSNPPFNQAPQIVPLAYDYITLGIAMLLRLSYLEPCFTRKSNRAAWLAAHPPTKLVVLPRISFTGDGKTDNVTCAWMIWEKDPAAEKYIKVVPR